MKPFLTYQEQIDLLKQRGISIPSDSKGVNMLSKDNHYRLINGYKDLLLDAVPPDRYTNRSLNDFTALSDFDRGLKISFLNQLVQIETQFKGVISYESPDCTDSWDTWILRTSRSCPPKNRAGEVSGLKRYAAGLAGSTQLHLSRAS